MITPQLLNYLDSDIKLKPKEMQSFDLFFDMYWDTQVRSLRFLGDIKFNELSRSFQQYFLSEVYTLWRCARQDLRK